MPFSARILELTDSMNYEGEDWKQNLFLARIKQLAMLGQFAQDMFSGLQSEVQQISSRSSRLATRVERLQANAESNLVGAKALKITSAGSLERSYRVKEHYVSAAQQETTGYFTPLTRPPHLRGLYAAVGRRGEPLRTESSATQTEKSYLSIEHEQGSVEHELDAVGVDTSGPGPQQCKSDLVAVDVSGATLQRLLRARTCQETQRSRPPRRNTSSAAPQNKANLSAGINIDSIELPKSKTVPQEDIYDWTPDSEFNYDYLPFETRKKSLLSDVYASIRRPKRKSREPLPSAAKVTSTTESPASVKGADTPQFGKVRQLLRRSVSLRLRTKKRWESVVYEQLPYHAVRPPSQIPARPKNLDRKESFGLKRTLPISTTSQVIHLATTIRHEQPTQQPERLSKTSGSSGYVSCRDSKLRRASTVSLSSEFSLDLDQRSSQQGWYRRGYQLDFPEECVNGGSFARGLAQRRLTSSVAESSSSQSSPRDPLADSPDLGSAAGDSTYSCDQEGYFTSMRRESGLLAPPSLLPCSSAAGPSTTEASRVGPVTDSSGDSGAEDLQSPYSEQSARIEYERKIQITAVPSLCQVSVSSDSPVPDKSPMVRHDTHRSTLPRTQSHTDATRNSEYEALDHWLLNKFQAEVTIKNSSNDCSNKERKSFFSLPRNPKPSPHQSPTARCATQIMTNSRLQSRKIVRFCE